MAKNRVIKNVYISPSEINIGSNKIYNNDGTIQFINSEGSGFSNIQVANINSSEIAGVNTGTIVVDTIALDLCNAARYDYSIINGNNLRSGSIMVVWNTSNIKHTEYSTEDIGDTNAVTFFCIINGLNMELKCTSLSDGWAIKISKFLI